MRYLLHLATGVMFAGSMLAQAPPGGVPSQTQPGMPQSTQPGMPGRPTTPSTFPDNTDARTQDQRQMQVDRLAADKAFVKDAAEGSAMEIELGKLAQEKASSDAVKDFGKRMVEDHTKASEELKRAAAKANIPVPAETSRKGKKAQEKLSKLSGPDFDRAYMKMMVSDHKSDVKAFERESRSGAVPEIKNFAASTLPTLEEHYKLAEQIAANPSKTSETGTASREKAVTK
jgi:putative membrane protein